MKKVITYGTFDLFHVGHLRLLERLRRLGDHLTVGVSSDEFNAIKGKQSIVPYQDRAAIIRSLRCVDDVFPERTWDQKIQDVVSFGIDTFGMGEDWRGKFDFLAPFCNVIYLPRTDGISSTLLRQKIGFATIGN